MSQSQSRNGQSTYRWDPHPGVRSHDDLRFPERLADNVRDAMGTWMFLAVLAAVTATWAVSRGFGLDPAPFSGLNVIQSTVAMLQTAVLLIAARRADQISSELAKHDHLILSAMREYLEAGRRDWPCKHLTEAIADIEEHLR